MDGARRVPRRRIAISFAKYALALSLALISIRPGPAPSWTRTKKPRCAQTVPEKAGTVPEGIHRQVRIPQKFGPAGGLAPGGPQRTHDAVVRCRRRDTPAAAGSDAPPSPSEGRTSGRRTGPRRGRRRRPPRRCRGNARACSSAKRSWGRWLTPGVPDAEARTRSAPRRGKRGPAARGARAPTGSARARRGPATARGYSRRPADRGGRWKSGGVRS